MGPRPAPSRVRLEWRKALGGRHRGSGAVDFDGVRRDGEDIADGALGERGADEGRARDAQGQMSARDH